MKTLTAGQTIIKALKMQDAARPRSLQVELGVSGLGGCRARAWHTYNKTAKTNLNTSNLAAIMGTAIHAAMDSALDLLSFGTYLTEYEVSYEGMDGHIDWYWEEHFEVVDLKTGTKKNAGYFPKPNQWWQVMVYGYYLIKAGKRVDTVTLVMICRDGDENDVLEVSRPYDESIALEALAWYEDVKSREVVPEPEMQALTFCKSYCPYFGACPGLLTTTKRKRHY
jgi:hypothetical protein